MQPRNLNEWRVVELEPDHEGGPNLFGLERDGDEKPVYVTLDRDQAQRECDARNRALRGAF